jgi:hypothetical protein
MAFGAFRDSSWDLEALTLEGRFHAGSRANLPFVVGCGAQLDMILWPDGSVLPIAQDHSLTLLILPFRRVPLPGPEQLPRFVAPGMLDFDPRSQTRLPSSRVLAGG